MAAASHPDARWLPERDGWRPFEIDSRGDRVTARLRLPAAANGAPTALWIVLADDAPPEPDGVAVLRLDLPLRGARRAPKWSERLERCLARGASDRADGILLEEFLAQSVTDVRAALTACATLPALASAPVGLLGVGAGALVGARLRAEEPRLAALALAPDGLATSLAAEAELDRAGDPPCFRVTRLAAGVERLRNALGG